jgi:two-component system, cell cycle sensor histidine kinase and response regulator CckA
MRLRTRIGLALGGAVTAAIGAVGLPILAWKHHQAEAQLARDAEASLARLSAGLAGPAWTLSYDQAGAVLTAELANAPHLAWISLDLGGSSGVVLARQQERIVTVTSPPGPPAGLRKLRHADAGDRDLGTVQIGLDREPLESELQHQALSLLAMLAAAAAATWIAAHLVVQRLVLRRLERLGAALATQPEAADTSSSEDEVERAAAGAEALVARLVAVLDAIEDAVITVDRDLRVQRANPAALRLLGTAAPRCALEELLALRMQGGVAFAGTVRRALVGNQRLATDEPLIVALGDDQRQVMASALPLAAPGGLVLVLRDVTELLSARDRISMANRLETIGRISASLAHDANNLLTAISSATELAAISTESGVRRRYADTAQAAVQQAAELYRQVQRLARRQEIARQPLELDAVLTQAEAILAHALGRNVELTCHGGASMPILGDRAALVSCIINLAINARDAGAKRVAISAARLTTTVAAFKPPLGSGAWAVLEVVDDGGGIPSEMLPRLFEPFATTKAQDKGTGLGLASVQRTIHDHGGSIAVETVQGRGTTFRLALPLLI